jgi:hypothetical protein
MPHSAPLQYCFLGMLHFAVIMHTLRRYKNAAGKRERGRKTGLEAGRNGPNGNAVSAGCELMECRLLGKLEGDRIVGTS